VSSFLSKLS